MKDIVIEETISDITSADIPYYTIKSDGTRDRTNTENVSVALRYVKDGKVHEELIGMLQTDKCDAESMSVLLLEYLDKVNLKPANILSQCYDGASVMSGKHGGVQKKLQEKIGKHIPYVHCFSHQLHLVVVHCMEKIDEVRKYFELCAKLYNFIRRPKVAAIYDGTKIKRLLEQRWTGHLETTDSIIRNHAKIANVLEDCCDSGNDVDVSVEATGLLSCIRKKEFLFIALTIKEVLQTMKPANDLLQDRTCDLLQGARLVRSTAAQLHDMRMDESNRTCDAIERKLREYDLNDDDEMPRKRKRRIPDYLRDDIVDSTLGHSHTLSPEMERQRLFKAIIDTVLWEMRDRFSDTNSDLLSAMSCILPSSEKFLLPDDITQFAELLKVNTSDTGFRSECEVARKFILGEIEGKSISSVPELCELLLPMTTAFPSVYKLYAGVLAFGASTAV